MTQHVAANDIRERWRKDFVEGMPGHFSRAEWDGATLRSQQLVRLRALLAKAQADSPYHARRLGSLDPARFELEDLADLAVMTKPDMMAHFDEVVTDARLSAAAAAAHLARAGSEPDLFLDDYIILASGGSSGVRGMFAMSGGEFVEFVSSVLRVGLRQIAGVLGWPLPFPVPFAIVAAPNSMHATRATSLLLDGTVAVPHFAPATLPFHEIVENVQRAQPMVLVGYASTLARLADAQTEGRLTVQPRMVISTSEQLTPEHSARIARGFGMPPVNGFASSEGLVGSTVPGGDVFTFASDTAIVEFVDEHDRPVTPGNEAHHVLVTNLFNHTQPLIRYRLDDRMTEVATPGGDVAHQRATLSGRTDDYLDFGGIAVHPLTVRSTMLRHAEVLEYQVTTTPRSLDVAVVASGAVNLGRLEADLARALDAAAARAISVSCRQVEQLQRDPGSGKVRLFVAGG